MEREKRQELTCLGRDLNHDLGRRIALNVRAITQLKSQQALTLEDIAAVRRDLLQTKRTPNGIRSATELWSDFKAAVKKLDLPPLSPAALETADLTRQLDELFTRLSDFEPILRADKIREIADRQTELFSTILAVSESILRFCHRLEARNRE